jgi:hypothetical protein
MLKARCNLFEIPGNQHHRDLLSSFFGRSWPVLQSIYVPNIVDFKEFTKIYEISIVEATPPGDTTTPEVPEGK